MDFTISQSRLFFQDEISRPLGRLTLAGEIYGSAGLDPRHPRVLGRYALIGMADGAGFYRDARGQKTKVTAGQGILIFPELAHAYGPTSRTHWSEIYVCFDGPIFDLWRHEGLLRNTPPVFDLPSLSVLFDLREVLSEPRPITLNDHLRQLNRFLAILGAALPLAQTSASSNSWLERSQSVLSYNLEKANVLQDAARAAEQSYETFRKNFAREVGLSPARFRDERRIEAAKTLLLRGEMTNAAIARSLGFRDESHFSRRFKELTKQTPRDFRRAARDGK